VPSEETRFLLPRAAQTLKQRCAYPRGITRKGARDGLPDPRDLVVEAIGEVCPVSVAFDDVRSLPKLLPLPSPLPDFC